MLVDVIACLRLHITFPFLPFIVMINCKNRLTNEIVISTKIPKIAFVPGSPRFDWLTDEFRVL